MSPYDFTAGLEEELDDISGGRIDWQDVLGPVLEGFPGCGGSDGGSAHRRGAGEKSTKYWRRICFPTAATASIQDPARPAGTGMLALKTARSGGAFIGCGNYPNCRFTRSLGGEDGADSDIAPEGNLLGHDDNGTPVSLRSGRFGPYVQLGEQDPESKEKPKRSSLPKGVEPADVTLEMALDLLSLAASRGISSG